MNKSIINRYLVLSNRLSVSRLFMGFWTVLFVVVAYVQTDWFSFYLKDFIYVFEWVFALISLTIFWQYFHFKLRLDALTLLHILLSIFGGFMVYFTTLRLNFPTPFELWNPIEMFKNILVGPLIHELLFRFALWVPIQRLVKSNIKWLLILSSLLYSFNHFNHIFHRPQSMHTFYYFHTAYTLFLGLWWGWIYLRKQNFLHPLLVHIVFNFGFYMGPRLLQ